MLFEDDEPTEPGFSVQRCPACEALTAVPRFLSRSRCEACLFVFDPSDFGFPSSVPPPP